MTDEREAELRAAIAELEGKRLSRKQKFVLIGEPSRTAYGTIQVYFKPVGVALNVVAGWFTDNTRPIYQGRVYVQGLGWVMVAEFK